MKVLQINLAYKNGSTGKIVYDIQKELMTQGSQGYVVYCHGKYRSKYVKPVKNKLTFYLSVIESRLGGSAGFYDKHSTKKVLKWINTIKPDIVHLHNIHGFYINVEMLFEYLDKKKIPVVWTLHDCWSMTGHCAHFDYVGCQKWKTGCYDCEQLLRYPIAYRDKSKINYEKKKRTFTLLNNRNLKIITPSKWLCEVVDKSYLSKYQHEVITNGIDLEIFKEHSNDIRKRYKLENKKIVLAVTDGYNERKGIEDINSLADMLNEDYQVILVGIEKRDYSKINKKIITVSKVFNQTEMASYYSAADVYVNTTLEDTFPTTNLEALACGTPVITYDSGGSPECVDEKTGSIVKKHDINEMIEQIENITDNKKKEYYKIECRKRAIREYNKKDMIKKYLELYNTVIDNN